MTHVPKVLEDMESSGLPKNLITYSTLLKGHCQSGDVDEGFRVFNEMRRSTSFRPDEIMYNSLMDGCAQHNRVEEGLKVLEEMQEDAIPPSNFTLSIVVKIWGYKAKKLDEAFRACERIQRQYNIPKLNVHVYTNLIQACVFCRDLSRALQTLDEMVNKARIRPEMR